MLSQTSIFVTLMFTSTFTDPSVTSVSFCFLPNIFTQILCYEKQNNFNHKDTVPVVLE